MISQERLDKIRKILGYVEYALVFAVFFALFLNTTIWGGMSGSPFFGFAYSFLQFFDLSSSIIISVVGIVMLGIGWIEHFIVIASPEKKPAMLIFKTIIFFIVYYLVFLSPERNMPNYIWITLFMPVIASDVKEDKILRGCFWIGVCFIVLFFFLSMLGFVENNRGNSFGFVYRTDYACHLLCLVLIWCIVKDGWLTWIGELGLIGVSLYTLFVVKGKTAFICLAVIIIATMYRHYRGNGGVPYQNREKYGSVIPAIFRVLYLPIGALYRIAGKVNAEKCRNVAVRAMKYSFVIGALTICLLTVSYKAFPAFWKNSALQGTFVSRLYMNQIGFEEFPINLSGNHITMFGNGNSEKTSRFYYYLDSSYVNILLQYGLIVFGVFLSLMTIPQLRLYRKKRYYTMFVLSVFALDCIVEHHMPDLSYNAFILLAFCILSNQPGIEKCDGLSLEKMSSGKRRALASGAMALCACFGLWCFTAYRITNWRGWTPNYAATLVIPAETDALLQEGRLNRAKQYLNSKDDAVCVVASETDKAWLTAQGIGEERVYIESYNSVDEMLMKTSELIDAKNLPARLTVCTYDIQQENIRRHAAALHVPVNSLTMKVPSSRYLECFTAEQWRLLCGK